MLWRYLALTFTGQNHFNTLIVKYIVFNFCFQSLIKQLGDFHPLPDYPNTYQSHYIIHPAVNGAREMQHVMYRKDYCINCLSYQTECINKILACE